VDEGSFFAPLTPVYLPVMTRRDLSSIDASSDAASQLEYILRQEKQKEENVKTVSAQEAMSQAPVFVTDSERDITRVLFISQNTELLNPSQQTLDGYLDLSSLFDEVHILILRQGIAPKSPVLRVSDKMWIYTVSTKHWWQSTTAALELLEDQLVFANGFRPDLIVARDPFESAIVAYKAGQKYNKPTQLHIMKDYTGATTQASVGFWRRFLTRFTIPRFESVRTVTSYMQSYVQKRFVITDIATLPRYQNYAALIDAEDSIDLKHKYQPHIFFLLYVGNLSHESTLHRALDASRFTLKNPRVGMVVLGDGVAKNEFIKRSRVLKIEEQVIFESNTSELTAYLKSAHILVVTDTDGDSDELVLKAAACGIPMVMARNEKREDIFTHGESAFLCDPADVQAFTDNIDILQNDMAVRNVFKMNAKAIIREHFHGNPDEYREAYRTSIEQAFFIDAAGDEE
jgi:glycosyltransferase involved in cell wall biosynthesis